MRGGKATVLIASGPVDVQGRRGDVARTAGYSPIELRRAGMSEELARARGIPIDANRKTGIGANVMRLRELILN